MTVAGLHFHSDAHSALAFPWLDRHNGAAVIFGCLLFWSAIAAALYFAL